MHQRRASDRRAENPSGDASGERRGLGCQRIELLCGGQLLSAGCDHLALLKHVHEFDSRQRAPSAPEGLESEHGTDNALHRTMVLLHYVIQILVLTDLNRRASLLLNRFQGRRVGPALIDRNLLRKTVLAQRFAEEPPCGFLVTVRRQ